MQIITFYQCENVEAISDMPSLRPFNATETKQKKKRMLMTINLVLFLGNRYIYKIETNLSIIGSTYPSMVQIVNAIVEWIDPVVHQSTVLTTNTNDVSVQPVCDLRPLSEWKWHTNRENTESASEFADCAANRMLHRIVCGQNEWITKARQ